MVELLGAGGGLDIVAKQAKYIGRLNRLTQSTGMQTECGEADGGYGVRGWSESGG